MKFRKPTMPKVPTRKVTLTIPKIPLPKIRIVWK